LGEESFTVLWHQKIGEISAVLSEVYDKHTFNHDAINSALLMILYLRYDMEADFMQQFTANCTEALQIVEMIAAKA